MIWLLPAALCSVSIALILKQSEAEGRDRLLLVGANYITASLLAFLFILPNMTAPNGTTLLLGAVTGIDYVLGFLVLAAGIARGPLAVPVTVMRLSVAVPIVVSIALWAERPGGFQWAGLAIGAAAILLFGYSLSGGRGRRSGGGGGYWMLIVALFLVMGAGDVLLKAFAELVNEREARLLAIPSYRQRIAEALFTGLWSYADSVSRATIAPETEPETEKGS